MDFATLNDANLVATRRKDWLNQKHGRTALADEECLKRAARGSEDPALLAHVAALGKDDFTRIKRHLRRLKKGARGTFGGSDDLAIYTDALDARADDLDDLVGAAKAKIPDAEPKRGPGRPRKPDAP